MNTDLISRQAVIDSLYDWSNHSMTNAETWHLKQIIGDIKSMPSVTPKPCEDAISRDAVWNIMQELWGTSGELMDRLMALPSVTPKLKPCDDAISRQEALDCLNGKIKMSPDMVETFREYLQGVIDAIEGLASVMSEKRTGHWIKTQAKQGGISETWYNCSECGWRNALYLPKSFCPNCGCRMIEPQESEVTDADSN